MKQLSNEAMKSCVLRTLIYADIFDYPLTAEQLHGRFHGKKYTRKDTEKTRASTENGVGADTGVRPCGRDRSRPVPTEVKETLDQLIKSGQIKKKGKYYFLPGRGEIVELRKRREVYSKKKIEIAKKIASLIKFLPTIKFVGISGNIAAGNARKNDDIDLFIISSRGWLWTTRFLITVLVAITGYRRRPGNKNIKDKICLNLFVDESNLDGFDHNLFIAHEIFNLKPLINKNDTYEKFLSANQWVKRYLPNCQKFKNLKPKVFSYNSRSATIVEKLFRRIQLWWMRKRKTTEITQPDLIAFHPEDISQKVLNEYQKRVRTFRTFRTSRTSTV